MLLVISGVSDRCRCCRRHVRLAKAPGRIMSSGGEDLLHWNRAETSGEKGHAHTLLKRKVSNATKKTRAVILLRWNERLAWHFQTGKRWGFLTSFGFWIQL